MSLHTELPHQLLLIIHVYKDYVFSISHCIWLTIVFFSEHRMPKCLLIRLESEIWYQNSILMLFIQHRGCLENFQCMTIEKGQLIVCDADSMDICQCMRSK